MRICGVPSPRALCKELQEMKAASMRKAEGVAGGVRADGQGTESYVELLPPENDAGKIEYKLKLINVPPSRFQHLVSAP